MLLRNFDSIIVISGQGNDQKEDAVIDSKLALNGGWLVEYNITFKIYSKLFKLRPQSYKRFVEVLQMYLLSNSNAK